MNALYLQFGYSVFNLIDSIVIWQGTVKNGEHNKQPLPLVFSLVSNGVLNRLDSATWSCLRNCLSKSQQSLLCLFEKMVEVCCARDKRNNVTQCLIRSGWLGVRVRFRVTVVLFVSCTGHEYVKHSLEYVVSTPPNLSRSLSSNYSSKLYSCLFSKLFRNLSSKRSSERTSPLYSKLLSRMFRSFRSLTKERCACVVLALSIMTHHGGVSLVLLAMFAARAGVLARGIERGKTPQNRDGASNASPRTGRFNRRQRPGDTMSDVKRAVGGFIDLASRWQVDGKSMTTINRYHGLFFAW